MSEVGEPASITLRLPPAAAWWPLAGETAGYAAARAGLSAATSARLRLALREACANACSHGRLAELGAPLVIRCDLLPGGALRVAVADQGPGFNPDAVPRPSLDAPLEKRRLGGLGVHLMRHLVDRLEVVAVEGGHEVWLCVDARGEEGEAAQ